MTRAFTTREKVLLVILAVLIIIICYFKFLLEPINDSVDNYQLATAAEQDEIIANTALLQRMNAMRAELDEIYASGDAVPMPKYDNSDAMLVELNTILSRASDYSLTFASPSPLSDSTYIMRRAVSFNFNAASYATARAILDDLHDSENVNQLSDLSISFGTGGSVAVSASISYFELIE